jgi:hypothetical protein
VIWQESHRASRRSVKLADRHYSRQKPGTPQFVPPGRCVVLYAKTDAGSAYWVTSWPFPEFVKHAWPGAWVCSAFRNEGAGLASELITEAVAATLHYWPEPPALGIVTFIDPGKVRHKRDPGRCYRKAGWARLSERTKKDNLIVYQLLPADMPPACPPLNAALALAF